MLPLWALRPAPPTRTPLLKILSLFRALPVTVMLPAPVDWTALLPAMWTPWFRMTPPLPRPPVPVIEIVPSTDEIVPAPLVNTPMLPPEPPFAAVPVILIEPVPTAITLPPISSPLSYCVPAPPLPVMLILPPSEVTVPLINPPLR